MSVLTSRTKAGEKGEIFIDFLKCSGCGLCVDLCSASTLELIETAENQRKAQVKRASETNLGCIACGHCMAICSNEAIKVEGRTLKKEHVFEFPDTEPASYEQIFSSLAHRRSIRKFKDLEISDEIVKKIIDAAALSPMGIPPTGVEVLVLSGKQKVRDFSFAFIDSLEKNTSFFNKFTLKLLRFFIGKDNYEFFTSFILPVKEIFIKEKKQGRDMLFYDAPLALGFYSVMADPADSYIAATHAMLAAQSLGLGTCMIGSVFPILKHMKPMQEKYKINPKFGQGIILLCGYSKHKFTNGIKRTFANIIY